MTVERSGASLSPVYARADGTVFDLPGFVAAADSGAIVAADSHEFIPMPKDSLLLTLPSRAVVAFDRGVRAVVDDVDGVGVNAVAAALPLGYTRTLLPAFEERPGAPPLPLYGYAAVVWDRNRFWVGAVKTDELESWSAALHGRSKVEAGIAALRLEFRGNPLIGQLSRCATEYGCFTAQNVFLRTGEAAIPVSPACNARCIGCISEQEPDSGIESAQSRTRVVPSVDEIAAIASAHLRAVPSGIVSFGQGCEGEPLLAAPRLADAIRAIRAATPNGTIHCNTNASRPHALHMLLDAGLQSVRVSLNSARPNSYAAYYRPQGYSFADIEKSLRIASEAGARISLNLLTHPGVTDDPDEMEAFGALLREHRIEMVQTRTLNIDPARYFAAVGRPRRKPAGMREWLRWLRAEFPGVRVGNFTRGFG